MLEQEAKQLNDREFIVMKLLHYFITEKNYNPIILQGVENEIWLENLTSDYQIVRIVSNYIHNDEQMNFDLFKTKRIVRKIKAKTFSFHMNTLSIYTDLGDSASLIEAKDITSIKAMSEEELLASKPLLETFSDIKNKLSFSEEGIQLFLKITNDINEKNKKDASQVEDVFAPKKPVVTYVLILINMLLFFGPKLFGCYDEVIDLFCTHGPSIRILSEYYRLLTGAFLHGSLMHLLLNCYSLFVIGSQVESFLGKGKMLVIYLFSALCGSLLSITFSGRYASVGASGALFGLMGAILYFGYHYRVYLGNVMKSQIIPLILINLGYGFLVSGIDNAAHIGGLIGGCLMTIALGIKYKSTKFEQIHGIIVTVLFTAFLLYMGLVYAR